MTDYFGFETTHLSNDILHLECLKTAGPRIVRLSYRGSENLLAEVPFIAHPTPYGEYRYLGGHRLWHSPEMSPRTYIPDLDGLSLEETNHGLILTGKSEAPTGMRKRIEIRLDPAQALVTVIHTLTNEGLWPVDLAAWALTMLRLGGMLILPVRTSVVDRAGLLPDRHFTLWPYSQMGDPRLQLGDDFIQLHARRDLPPFKIGIYNPAGWMAYWLDGVLFRISFDTHAGMVYPDFNSNCESYCDSRFIEMESLSPLTRLAPGQSLTHTETWQFFDSLDQDFLPEELAGRPAS